MPTIPDVPKDALVKSMEEFDRHLRDTPKFVDWESSLNQLYAIDWQGRRYPPKEIISMATGKPVGKFSGGKSLNQANTYVRNRGFKIIQIRERNPKWMRDELILALDFYLKHRTTIPSKTSPEIEELSVVLNRIGNVLGLAKSEKYRNVNGVYMKLMNFRRLDPEYTSGGKVGLTRGGKEEVVVWADFASKPDYCHQVATAIREAIEDGTAPQNDAINDEDDDITEAEEGKILTRLHRSRERSRKIVRRKKDQVLRKLGKLECECCNFDFATVYGERGVGFIECHHKKPVADLKAGARTRLEDLALVCANCHRMIHRKKPWLQIKELIALLSP